MEIARQPFPMQRTHTAPMGSTAFTAAPTSTGRRPTHMSVGAGVGAGGNTGSAHSSLVHSQAHTSSNYSIQSQQSSRSSDTTQGTTHSTLFPSAGQNAAAPAAGGEVTATDNIMNTVADASSSLFQICVTLRRRLHAVPGFSDALCEVEDEAYEDDDPVSLLWRTFRRGEPLMLLYNELRPEQPLSIPPATKADKRPKAAAFKFLNACISVLKFPAEDCFILNDLFSDDTTGFVKVANVVTRVLDILVQQGLIEDARLTESSDDFEKSSKGIKRTQRQHIVAELVSTERTYVQHLELLQRFKQCVKEKGVLSGDALHHIFLNLDALLDFQRRFLIRVEQTNDLPEEEQNWGKLFVLYADAFKVYEPYIANQRHCEQMVVAEFIKLREAGGSDQMRQMIESPTSLYGFLMKPFQRLSRYPLLLDDLYKKGDLDEDRKKDLLLAKEATTSVLARTNKAIDIEEKVAAVAELRSRVEDWKGHKVENFGPLLLCGTFTVIKSDSAVGGKDGERQYHVYLFDTILLCCKDIDLSKPKNKLSNRALVDKRGKPKLQLKGRIFMQNVTDLVSLAKPGSYTCQIYWKGDPGIENFIIRFTTEETMKTWKQQIDAQRRKHQHRCRHSSSSSRVHGTSTTEFVYMQNQPSMENPYARAVADDDDDDDDDDHDGGDVDTAMDGAYADHMRNSRSRNSSQTSLRSKGTLGDSGAIPSSTARGPMPRLPAGSITGGPQLSLRTRELLANSPGVLPPSDSYFSPAGESPQSSVRTSTSSSSAYPFPRQPLAPNGSYEDGHGHGHGHGHGQSQPNSRFTAPAIARARQSSGTPEPHFNSGHQRPSIMHSSSHLPAPARNRSLSSPNIHNIVRAQVPGQQPPVPDVPAPYLQNPHMVPRSQSNSPSLPNGSRTSTQSPHPHRERGHAMAPNPHRPSTSHSPDDSPTDVRMSSTTPNGNPYQPHSRPETSMQPHPDSRTVAPVPNHHHPYHSNSQNLQPLVPPFQENSLGAPVGPAQVKVRVQLPTVSQTLLLVVPVNISYASLRDRIDAKLQRSTNLSLTSDRVPRECQVKLMFLDDEDLCSIQSDEDVATAFETWAEQRGEDVSEMGEIELFCKP